MKYLLLSVLSLSCIFLNGQDSRDYNFYDFYAKALYAKDNKKYDDGIFYYRKATEAKGFSGLNAKTRMYSYFNWAFCLYNIAVKDANADFHKEAINKYKIAITIDPEFAMSYNNIGASILDLAIVEKTLEKKRGVIEGYLLKAHKMGEKEYSTYNLTRFYSYLNENDNALEWFEKMLVETDRDKARIDSYRSLDNIRRDPRFDQLMRKYRP